MTKKTENLYLTIEGYPCRCKWPRKIGKTMPINGKWRMTCLKCGKLMKQTISANNFTFAYGRNISE